MMTVNDAATRLGMTPDGVRNLIRNGKLKATRHGERVYMIAKDDLKGVKRGTPGRKKNQ